MIDTHGLGPEISLLDRAILRSMLAGLAAHDRALAQHAVEVGRLTRLVAIELGWPAEAVADAVLVGVLHDLGKLTIPPGILNKPGPLTRDEWALMRDHPRQGADMTEAHGGIARIRDAVAKHHERADGLGYPHGLVGDDVPAAARVVAVCDAYCAMREERPYAPAVSESEALNELWAAAGTQFDVDAVCALERVLRRVRNGVATDY
jgi:two-component system, cell cycle response regulator